VWSSWSDKAIVVYVDDGDGFYVKGGEGQLAATCCVARRHLGELIAALKQGLAWGSQAKAGKTEVQKEIISFFTLRADGSGRQTGIGLTFSSSNQGRQTDVVLEIKDFDPPFGRIVLYLDPAQVIRFIALLEKVPATHQALLQSTRKNGQTR
jgi:hypothetical protein